MFLNIASDVVEQFLIYLQWQHQLVAMCPQMSIYLQGLQGKEQLLLGQMPVSRRFQKQNYLGIEHYLRSKQG